MNTTLERHECTISSPVGPLRLVATQQALCFIQFENARGKTEDCAQQWDSSDGSHPILSRAKNQLDAYFSGERQSFDLPLAPRGTPFQVQTWQALSTIPFGATISYGSLAQRVGRSRAVRAVGAANGRNPLPIVLPCHRVIGANGSLTGFAGGLKTKAYLLGLESGVTPLF